MKVNDFNLDPEFKDKVKKFIQDAISDNWIPEPTYNNEDISKAVSLSKNGFEIMSIMRGDSHYSIHAWCPKGISLEVTFPYSFQQLQDNINLCGECHQIKENIQRVAFANRVCNDCLNSAKKKYEFPGWSN
jgi:hypothetical protein